MGTRIIGAIILLIYSCVSNYEVKGDPNIGLSFDFYSKTCPQLEKIVADVIKLKFNEDPQTAGALLRLLYNDCAVQGCDASILLDTLKATNQSEINSPNNFGIRKRELIGEIKSMVDKVCPDKVSCADILVLAAREAVAVTKGPIIHVPLGRRDSTVAYTRGDVEGFQLPPPDTFIARSMGYLDNLGVGLTEEEMVALLGAHTLGISHCTSIQERVDFPGIKDVDKAFVNKLRKLCPKGASSNKNTSLANDRTPYIFDRDYFIQSFGGRGLLVTDNVGGDPFTVTYAGKFAQDQNYFFNIFSSAFVISFVKLSTSQILTGNAGEIRKQCNKLNGA